MTTTDKIEKRVVLKAPVSRVWRALTDAKEFGHWFGVTLDGEFVAGQPVTGTFGKGFTEEGIIEHQKKLGVRPSKVKFPDDHSLFCRVERMEPEHYFSFRWVPYGIDAEREQDEPMTLVEFQLERVAEGTALTIAESGFDRVPAHRRERAFRMNEGGWTAQAENLRKHVEG